MNCQPQKRIHLSRISPVCLSHYTDTQVLLDTVVHTLNMESLYQAMWKCMLYRLVLYRLVLYRLVLYRLVQIRTTFLNLGTLF